MPDFDERRFFRAQNGVSFSIEIIHDISPPNPMEDFDGNGKIHSFNRRHYNFLDVTKHGCWTIEEAIEQLEFMFGPRGTHWMPLSYYEHGNSSWFPAGDQPIGVEFQWDGTRFAGVWEMDELVRENLGDPEADGFADSAYKYCKGVCDEYTNWCNGWVYGYSIEIIKPDGAESEDSCFGFFGWDWEKNGMLDYVLNALECEGIESVRELGEDEVFAIAEASA